MVCEGGSEIMGYHLEKIVMHNFKLFSHAEINMEPKSLIMLDGPNGYGKTSTFDALEYLLTGNVKRVSENGVSKSNISFEEDCLIKSPSDGTLTYVKGFFCNQEGEKLEITRELSDGKGAENNPSKIKSRTKTIVAWKGQIYCEEENVENANKVIMHYIGEATLNHYDQFYYIAQEDRLKFLSKSESDRIQEIQKLFGIQKEEETLTKIEKVIRKISDLKKEHLKKVKDKKTEMERFEEELKEKKNGLQIEYKDLIGDKEICPVWNKLHLQIQNKEKLLEMAESIKAAGMFSQDIGWYKKDLKNEWIEETVKEREKLKKYLYLNSRYEDLDHLKEELQLYYEIADVLKQAKTETGNCDYEKYDYKKLKELLKLEIDLDEINNIQVGIEISRKNIKEEDAARTRITTLQKSIKKEWEAWQDNEYEGLADNQCPLCGQPYKDKTELLQVLDTYKQVIENGKGEFQKQIDKNIARLEEIFHSNYEESLKQYLKGKEFYKADICRQIYENREDILRDYRIFRSESSVYQISNNVYVAEEELPKADEILAKFIKTLEESKAELSDKYCTNKEKYQYKSVLSLDYKNQLDKVQVISEADVNEKIQYIQQEYYGNRQKQLEDKANELKVLNEKADKFVGVECNLKELKERVKDELHDYKEKLVNQLKIPFYLYTGRILQNYPGGVGIWMNFAGDEKIRFEAERRKGHDVLYTLSSGQLSAVAIAISLTLNKIYAQDTMRCMFIDDPIQTMDELNIASFTEVLRTDFPEYQLVMSTHEEDFSDYIRYKYEKYGLGNCSVDVRDIEKKYAV